MMQLKQMMETKKGTVASLAGISTLAATFLAAVGAIGVDQTQAFWGFVVIVAAYLVGQGLADFGKEAKKPW